MRFRVSHNSRHTCTCGVNGDGVVEVCLSYVKRVGEASELKMAIGGMEISGSREEERSFISWESPLITTGDRVQIEVLAPGAFDSPLEHQDLRSRTAEDIDFGEIHFELGAWFGRFKLEDNPAIEMQFRCRSDERGIKESQRQRLRMLRSDYSRLWPMISDVLVACHRQLKSREDLAAHIKPFAFVDLCSAEDDETNLSYEFTNCSKRYYVKLRSGRVVENYAID